MAALWLGIRSHPRSSVAFALSWLATVAAIGAFWHDGISVGAMVVMAGIPFAMGLLMGAWECEKGATDCHPCGMLPGALIAAADVTVLFLLDWERGPTSGGPFDWGVVGLWMAVTVVFAGVGAGIGLVGGITAQVVLPPSWRERLRAVHEVSAPR